MLALQRSWEWRANDEEIDLVLDYIEVHHSDHQKRVEDSNGLGARIIVDGLLAYGWNSLYG
jgi:hypothetical protein